MEVNRVFKAMKKRIPRKLKKELKKKYLSFGDFDKKTKLIIFGIEEDGCWIVPKNEHK